MNFQALEYLIFIITAVQLNTNNFYKTPKEAKFSVERLLIAYFSPKTTTKILNITADKIA